MDDDLIIECYQDPLEWIALMRTIAMVVEYVRETTHRDVPMEEESSNDEDDTEEETQSDDVDSN